MSRTIHPMYQTGGRKLSAQLGSLRVVGRWNRESIRASTGEKVWAVWYCIRIDMRVTFHLPYWSLPINFNPLLLSISFLNHLVFKLLLILYLLTIIYVWVTAMHKTNNFLFVFKVNKYFTDVHLSYIWYKCSICCARKDLGKKTKQVLHSTKMCQ